MLANVIIFVKDTTSTWFETHETELTSWYVCKVKLKDLFGETIARQLLSKIMVATSAKFEIKPYVGYVEGVLSL